MTDHAQGGSSLCLLILLSRPLFRRPSYEAFLRTHQALAALLHTRSGGIYHQTNPFLESICMSVRGCFYSGVFSDAAAFFTRMAPFAMVIPEAGQYLNLWIPSVGFWPFLQSHPFVVTSWVDGRQEYLDFFIEPRRGLTRRLLSHAGATDSRLVMFSGPHGISAPVGEYESVLMIASGFGVAAHLPYLKRMIQGYNARKVHTRRIHLVWQLSNIGRSRAERSPAYTAHEVRNWNCS
jgi:FAD-binding domain/Ferric reductase NAD binding domain